MSDRLRVVIFHLGFFYSGGGEKLVLQEARWLRERGHRVDVYAPIVDERACFPELLAEIGPRALLARVPDVAGVGDALTLLLASLRASALTARLDADVYLGANQPGAWLARAAARRHAKRYVVYLSQPNRLLLPRAIDREARPLVMRNDFHLLSAAALAGRPVLDALDRVSMRDAAVRLGDGSYITTILRFYYGGAWRNCPAASAPLVERPSAVSARAGAVVAVNGVTVRAPFILLTNRHYPQKRFEDMFPVIERVRRTIPEATLIITGAHTPYTEVLRRAVLERGLSDAVRFLGLVSEADLDALYRAASLYVYPSPEEDFGMGLVEAMGRGAPVVAWDNAGPAAIVVDGVSGRLLPLGDIDAFAGAVLELLGDPEQADRIGASAWESAVRSFSATAHTDVLEGALYEAAGLAPAPPPAASASTSA